MNKDIDIIIYGATGFTGQLCVKYFKSLETKVSWAIAGRNLEILLIYLSCCLDFLVKEDNLKFFPINIFQQII